ncbi:polysaccharide biosynthesis/export protein [Rhodobiaceae bacterium]|nr:polysaccharide biosynthesis/export protein [Rhodobiaceae bacterium]
MLDENRGFQGLYARLTRCGVVLATSVVMMALAACAGQGPVPMAQADVQPVGQNFAEAYRLGAGDELRVIVFGEPDLSGEFEIDGSGAFSMPLIGQLDAFQLTVVELEKAIAARLTEGYLIDPRVNVEVLNYRPFYIVGEVKDGGEFPYVSGMHAVKAVAIAGGYTYRANTQKVMITRKGTAEEIEMPASQGTAIFPGDVIRIPERFF